MNSTEQWTPSIVIYLKTSLVEKTEEKQRRNCKKGTGMFDLFGNVGFKHRKKFVFERFGMFGN